MFFMVCVFAYRARFLKMKRSLRTLLWLFRLHPLHNRGRAVQRSQPTWHHIAMKRAHAMCEACSLRTSVGACNTCFMLEIWLTLREYTLKHLYNNHQTCNIQDIRVHVWLGFVCLDAVIRSTYCPKLARHIARPTGFREHNLDLLHRNLPQDLTSIGHADINWICHALFLERCKGNVPPIGHADINRICYVFGVM